MASIISSDDLTSYLPGVTIPAASLTLYVRLANGIVTDVIGSLEKIPERVEAITLEAAARGVDSSQPTSITTSFDDTTRTIRREGLTRAAAKRGVYLTDGERDELLRLAGKRRRRRAGTIHLRRS